jgi:hypothetical protein
MFIQKFWRAIATAHWLRSPPRCRDQRLRKGWLVSQPMRGRSCDF